MPTYRQRTVTRVRVWSSTSSASPSKPVIRGERICLLNGALANTGNAIGQLAQFNKDGTVRPPRE